MEAQSNRQQVAEDTEGGASAAASSDPANGAPEQLQPGVAPPAVSEDDGAGLAVRLETLLRERASEVRALSRERAHYAALLRELCARLVVDGAEETELAAHQSSAPEPSVLETRLRAAVERALDAEAARAEAVFKLDEVLGTLAQQQDNSAAAVQEGVEAAQLEGTARGLRAAVAELTEARDTAEARLMLATHDLEDARGRELGLERKIRELREQLEFEVTRAHSAVGIDAPAVDESARERHAGERAGLRLRLEEAERALLSLMDVRSSERRSAASTADQLGSTRAELGAMKGSHASMSARVNEMELHLARERQRIQELRGRVESLGGEMRGRESDVSALRSEREQLRQHLETLEVNEAARRDSLTSSAAVAERARQKAAGDAAQLRTILGETRDVLVALGAGIEGLTKSPLLGATEGLATVPGELESPDVDEPSAVEMKAQVQDREERLGQLERQHRADADAYTASLASHRAQLELSRGEVGTLREQLTRQQARIDAVRAAARSIRAVIEDESPVRPRVAELLQLLSD